MRFVEPNLTQAQDELLENAIYTLKNKKDFSVNERLEIYEKAISIFIEEKESILPVPKKRWKLVPISNKREFEEIEFNSKNTEYLRFVESKITHDVVSWKLMF